MKPRIDDPAGTAAQPRHLAPAAGTRGGPTRRRSRGRALLLAVLLGSAAGAFGADGQACDGAGCRAGRLDTAAVHAAVREVAREAARGAAGNPSDTRASTTLSLPATNHSNVWERNLGGPGAHEAYDCALSFGAGGTLGGDGVLATRLLGCTQIWRDK